MLTPLDVKNKVFKKGLAGYSAAEVDEFMGLVVTDYEKVYRDNIILNDKIKMLSDVVGQYKNMEDTMKDAILVAQNTAEEVKRNALDKAEAIIRDADSKAARMVEDAGHEVTKINYQREELRRSLAAFRAKVIALIEAQTEIVNGLDESEPAPPQASIFIPQVDEPDYAQVG